MGGDFPRCATCRVSIEPGVDVVFRPDGRVDHAHCPKVICPACALEVAPGTPIRRDGHGESMLHANCWMKRFRTQSVTAAVDARALIFAKLAAGSLPRLTPTKVWSGDGNGVICAACDQTIQRTAWEVEFAGTVTIRLHLTCFSIWDQERVKYEPHETREIGGGSSDSAWTSVFDHRLMMQARSDRAAFAEMLVVMQEVRNDAVALCARARAVRAARVRSAVAS